MRPGSGWTSFLEFISPPGEQKQGRSHPVADSGATTGPVTTSSSFNKWRYCGAFFAGFAGIVLGLRLIDIVLLRVPGLADSEPALQPLWSGILRRWPWTTAHAGFGGMVGIASFFISCSGFTVLDLRHSSTKVQKDYWPSAHDILEAAVPQTLIYVVANGLGYAFGYYAIQLQEDAPSVALFAEQVTVAFVVGDFLQYWEHRIMHMVPFLRKNVHSWHHAYHAPFSWAGGVVHPFEDMVTICCQIVTPVALGFHPLAFWTFTFIWVALLIEEHSGHDVWWAPYRWMPFASCPCGGGAAPHDIHHYKVTKNYAFVLSVWDQLFDSFEPVVEPPALPAVAKTTWWEYKGNGNLQSDLHTDVDKQLGSGKSKCQ
mmetsp:Transcript_124607/g.265808  ORF Transcript_124607/g.265808 Transcript_124607/m.265808 type:complete len:371 (-) Transcript_124607:158-1270(-)|eukprot:CAMPEP_0180696332 /NCGR_PEP_ID=MMETSP1038_2-20121128/2917_1 /TAXON_ID=632150 /ORGANISM="Azadinium spinosum, Strain 3D9" /LENGTH=370 /DNA_ID=CAMNT_0022727793 /DNA_START=50 /DNA_END=1162 /DNA_ORIENTATION=+